MCVCVCVCVVTWGHGSYDDASTLQVVTTIANLGGIDQFVNPSNITMISVRALRGEIVAERSSCALLWTQVNGHNMTLTQASYLITAMDFTNCIVFMLFICALQASCKRHVRFLCLSLYLSCVAFLSLSVKFACGWSWLVRLCAARYRIDSRCGACQGSS